MKHLQLLIILFLFFVRTVSAQDMIIHDWANLNRYKIENSELEVLSRSDERVVFLGNSITQQWKELRPEFFSSNSFVNRGISGQTTPQMLLRFRSDVVNLKPSVVVILAGTNDIAGNTGLSTVDMVAGNLKSMAELAKANDIKVILCSVLPAFDYPWNPGINPSVKIVELNKVMNNYAVKNDFVYLDYFKFMTNEENGMKDGISQDGVHPNIKGFEIMETIVKEAITKLLNKK